MAWRRHGLPRSDVAALLVLDAAAELDQVIDGSTRDLSRMISIIGSVAGTIETDFAERAVSPIAIDRPALRRAARVLGARLAAALRKMEFSASDATDPARRKGVASDLLGLLTTVLEAKWDELPEAEPSEHKKPIVILFRRVAVAAALSSFAVALPFLPGVGGSASLVGIQVGLIIGAVFALVGTPTETETRVRDALEKATGRR